MKQNCEWVGRVSLLDDKRFSTKGDPSTITEVILSMNLGDLIKEVPKEANEELGELLQSVNTKTMPQDDMATSNSYFSPASSGRDSSPPRANWTAATYFPYQSQ